MPSRPARVLVVDNSRRSLFLALEAALSRHHVQIAADAIDAIYQIDCEGSPHDVIFCDLASDDFPGPELWAYLSLGRQGAAERLVFIASRPLAPEARAFIERVPNTCVELPVDAEALDALVGRRAATVGPALGRPCRADDEPSSSAAE